MTIRVFQMAGNYTDVYTRLKSLPRQEANWWLSENVDNLEGEEWDNYRKGRRQEFHHFDHVRSIMKVRQGILLITIMVVFNLFYLSKIRNL